MVADKLFSTFNSSTLSGQLNYTNYFGAPLPIIFYSFFCQSGFTGSVIYGIRDTITSGTYNLSTITDTKDIAVFPTGNYIGKYCQSFIQITGAITGLYDINILQKGA